MNSWVPLWIIGPFDSRRHHRKLVVKNDLKYVFKFGYYHGIRAANQVSFHILQQKYFKTKYCQCYSDKQTAKVCKAQLTEHLQKKDFLTC